MFYNGGLCRHAAVASRYRLHASRSSSHWVAALELASKLVGEANDYPHPRPSSKHPDPLDIVGQEMSLLTANIRNLLGSSHPTLAKVAKYYVQATGGGKRLRPMLVLLVARATAPTNPILVPSSSSDLLNTSLSPSDVLNDDFGPLTSPQSWLDDHSISNNILPSQRRLAEITEMIHAASLLHDDVIDGASMRRDHKSANAEFGNKMAILAGDFLLGRASISLARLRNPEVIELLATVIANLIEGEFMQLENVMRRGSGIQATFDYYLKKTYLKTASLISKSCRAAAILGSADVKVVDAAYAFGRNIGIAFQLVDDMLDYSVSAEELGKPAGADLQLGLATAPVLFAWEKFSELGPLIQRKFSAEGDISRVSFDKSFRTDLIT